MALPYSTRFIAGALTAPASQSFTVPSGFRAVIRTITMSTGGTGGVSSEVQGPAGIRLAVVASLGANLTQTWDLRVVVNTGEAIVANALVGGIYITVSGYLLTTTP